MKTRKLTITLILAAIILAPLALAAAEENPRGSKKERGRPPRQKPTSRPAPPTRGSARGDLAQMLLGPMGQKLKLTDEQQKKIKAISEDSKTTILEGRKAVQKATLAWREAVEEGTEAKIIAAGKTVGDAFTQQGLKKAAVTRNIKAELTKEQLLKFKELQAKRKEQMQRRPVPRGKADDPKKRDSKAGRKPKKSKTKKTKKPEKTE